MPSIDCDMNPTAIGNDPKRAGRTGIVYLIVALFFFIGTFWKLGNDKPELDRGNRESGGKSQK